MAPVVVKKVLSAATVPLKVRAIALPATVTLHDSGACYDPAVMRQRAEALGLRLSAPTAAHQRNVVFVRAQSLAGEHGQQPR